MLIPREVIARAIVAAPVDETRYYLNGVHVVAKRGRVRVEATDGRIAYVWAGDDDGAADMDCIIPYAAVKIALKQLGKRMVFVDVTPSTIGVVIYEPINGTFPDMRGVFPTSLSGEPAIFDPRLLVRISDAMGIARGEPAMPQIHLNGDGPAVVVDGAGYWLIMPMRYEYPSGLDIAAVKQSLFG